MEIFLPNHIIKCISTLESHSFSAFCVGGAVRDILLGTLPDDYDIATNAKPSEVEKIFEQVIPTGIKHGTVTAIIDNIPVEITTYRNDGDYSDSRHPLNVEFVGDINTDLSRRDFTVNALAFSPKSGLIDNFSGISDINNKIIRTVGKAQLRFSEDALRILRAFRFCSTLGFKMEQNTFNFALELSYLLKNISRERIYSELTKLLCGKNPNIIAPLLKADLPVYLKPTHINNQIIDNLNKVCADKYIRYAYFCLAANFEPDILLKELKADNATKNTVTACFEVLKNMPVSSKPNIKRMLSKISPELLLKLIKSFEAVFSVDCKNALSSLNEIIKNNEPYLIKHLKITGDDIAALGAKGKQIGQIFDKLLQRVIIDQSLNNNKKLKEITKEYLK